MADFSTELDPFITALKSAMSLEVGTPSSIRNRYPDGVDGKTAWSAAFLARAFGEICAALADNVDDDFTTDTVQAALNQKKDFIIQRGYELMEQASQGVQHQ